MDENLARPKAEGARRRQCLGVAARGTLAARRRGTSPKRARSAGGGTMRARPRSTSAVARAVSVGDEVEVRPRLRVQAGRRARDSRGETGTSGRRRHEPWAACPAAAAYGTSRGRRRTARSAAPTACGGDGGGCRLRCSARRRPPRRACASATEVCATRAAFLRKLLQTPQGVHHTSAPSTRWLRSRRRSRTRAVDAGGGRREGEEEDTCACATAGWWSPAVDSARHCWRASAPARGVLVDAKEDETRTGTCSTSTGYNTAVGRLCEGPFATQVTEADGASGSPSARTTRRSRRRSRTPSTQAPAPPTARPDGPTSRSEDVTVDVSPTSHRNRAPATSVSTRRRRALLGARQAGAPRDLCDVLDAASARRHVQKAAEEAEDAGAAEGGETALSPPRLEAAAAYATFDEKGSTRPTRRRMEPRGRGLHLAQGTRWRPDPRCATRRTRRREGGGARGRKEAETRTRALLDGEA